MVANQALLLDYVDFKQLAYLYHMSHVFKPAFTIVFNLSILNTPGIWQEVVTSWS